MESLIPRHGDVILVVAALLLSAVLFVVGGRMRRQRRWTAFGLSLLASVFFLIGLNYIRIIPCVDRLVTPGPIRMADSLTCQDVAGLAHMLTNKQGYEKPDDRHTRCAVQTVLVPYVKGDTVVGPSSVSSQACWPADPLQTEFAPLCYQMAFLELDRDGQPLAAEQLDAIRSTIAADHAGGQEIYMIGFVHGWRNDASLGNPNVRDLRVEAAYAAAHLRERCRVAHEHCGARLLALYISWPAAIGVELPAWKIPCWMAGWSKPCDPDRRTWATLSAVPSFPSRKLVSDQIGGAILDRVTTIRSYLKPDGNLLLIGHSLGGNAILTGALPRIYGALRDAAARFDDNMGKKLADDRLGLPADLTVLINPASEARKLLDLRAHEAALFAGNPKVAWPSGDRWPLVGTGEAARRYWPVDMPPRLMIFAAPCDRKVTAAQHGTCDDVVEGAFPLSQKHVVGATNPLDGLGIGHLPRFSRGDILSSSHDVHVNGQGRAITAVMPKTTYAGAYDANFRCVPEPSWLSLARARGNDYSLKPRLRTLAGPRFSPWDLTEGKPDQLTLGLWAVKDAPGQSNIQFAYPGVMDPATKQEFRRICPGRKCLGAVAAVQSSDPVWAVHANPTFITTHNAFVSAPLFCALSKIVLDKPAMDRGSFDQHFDTDAADFRIRRDCAGGHPPSGDDVAKLFPSSAPASFWQRWERSGLSPFPSP